MKTTLLVYPRAGAGIIMHPAGLLSLWSWYIFLTVPNLKEESIFPGRYHRVRVWKVSKANIRILKTDFIFKIIQVNRSLTGEAITAFKPQRSSQLSYWLWKFSFNTYWKRLESISRDIYISWFSSRCTAVFLDLSLWQYTAERWRVVFFYRGWKRPNGCWMVLRKESKQ
jgi:hypothetical protein